MVCTANDLSAWKDFPKGLRVLLLDEDTISAAEIKSKLESMDYIVSVFCDEDEALLAVSGRPENFHVAIVEATTSNSDASFKFLEAAKDLPTIMTSNTQCLNIIMKCIALGAVEFLRKPLSEDKLKNIWQHVVHKAFSAGGNLSESLNPSKESVTSMMHPQLGKGNFEMSDEKENMGADKYPAPPTPQLKQVARLSDDGDCQDHTNCSMEKDSVYQEVDCKCVDITTPIAHVTKPDGTTKGVLVKEEEDLAVNIVDPHPQNKDGVSGSSGYENPCKASAIESTCGNKGNRKKMKVDWTAELHQKFVQAVEQLGVDHAIPSRILELMKVEGLTRHNVASHLQKYRMHRRNILPREDERRWIQPRDAMQRSFYPHKPIMAFPPYHSNTGGPVYPMWPAPAPAPPPGGMWGYHPQWQAADTWNWKLPCSGIYPDAWGCPVMRPPHGPYHAYPQNASGFPLASTVADNSYKMPVQDSSNPYPADEVIDNAVKEAISKPWLPLPLGLNPPSMDSVLSELSKQDISTVPSRTISASRRH